MSEPITNPSPAIEPETTPEKTFTQAEVDTLIGKRLAKAMKGMPSEEELTAFRTWKGNQQTEQDRWNTLTDERDTARNQLSAAQAELEQYKREKLLLSKGVAADDVDYYAFKIGKLVTDTVTFEKAAEQFLAEKKPGTVRVNFSAPVGGNGSAKTANEAMNALIRGALK